MGAAASATGAAPGCVPAWNCQPWRSTSGVVPGNGRHDEVAKGADSDITDVPRADFPGAAVFQELRQSLERGARLNRQLVELSAEYEGQLETLREVMDSMQLGGSVRSSFQESCVSDTADIANGRGAGSKGSAAKRLSRLSGHRPPPLSSPEPEPVYPEQRLGPRSSTQEYHLSPLSPTLDDTQIQLIEADESSPTSPPVSVFINNNRVERATEVAYPPEGKLLGEGDPLPLCKQTSGSSSGGSVAVPETQRSDLRRKLVLADCWKKTRASRVDYVELDSIKPSYSDNSEGRQVSGSQLTEESFLKHIIVPPTAVSRICWDLASLLMITYDMVTVPLIVFNYDTFDIALIFFYITNTFWSCDIVFSFLAGYHTKGLIEMRPSRTMSRYLKTWFVPDVIMVCSDWISQLDPLGVARTGKVAFRLARIVRILRLVRIAKLHSIWMAFSNMAISELSAAGFSALQLLLGVTYFNHCVACAWYACGTINIKDPTQTWVYPLVVRDVGLIYSYVVSFHWALCQFTPAPTTFHPESFREHLFTLFVVLLGMAVFSSFLGSMVNTLTQARLRASEHLKQQRLVRKFIQESQLPSELGHRILGAMRSMSSSKRRILEAEVAPLKELPETVLEQMHYHVYRDLVVPHPLWLEIDENYGGLFVKIVHSAMTERRIQHGSVLWRMGGEATKMIFVRSGGLNFTLFDRAFVDKTPKSGDETPMAMKKPVETFVENEWVGEVALWCNTRHTGSLIANSQAYVAEVNAERFRKVICGCVPASGLAISYARRFLASASTKKHPDAWSNIDDLMDFVRCATTEVPFVRRSMEVMSGRSFRSRSSFYTSSVAVSRASTKTRFRR